MFVCGLTHGLEVADGDSRMVMALQCHTEAGDTATECRSSVGVLEDIGGRVVPNIGNLQNPSFTRFQLRRYITALKQVNCVPSDLVL